MFSVFAFFFSNAIFSNVFCRSVPSFTSVNSWRLGKYWIIMTKMTMMKVLLMTALMAMMSVKASLS